MCWQAAVLKSCHTGAPSPLFVGTWIECVRCKKWRFAADIYDPSQVPTDWHCGNQAKWVGLDASASDACQEPEDEKSKQGADEKPFLYNEFTAGSIVWAKLSGRPLFITCFKYAI